MALSGVRERHIRPLIFLCLGHFLRIAAREEQERMVIIQPTGKAHRARMKLPILADCCQHTHFYALNQFA
jgi:hypothetical protein